MRKRPGLHNATLETFGYPGRLVREYPHWVVLLHPLQVTLGSVVVASKSTSTSFGALTPEEAAGLPEVLRDYEAVMTDEFAADKFNYLALMMKDPNPHLHGIPRYSSNRVLGGFTFEDPSYPKPTDFDVVNPCPPATLDALMARLRSALGARRPPLADPHP